MNKKIKIEIWSDVVCPFCYLGLRKLERALEVTGLNGHFEIQWHSFQLDPDFPVGITENTTAYLAERKGIDQSQVKQMYGQIAEQGRRYEIDFQFDKALSFNTLDAHRIIQWSKTTGRSTELEEAFFKAYFTQGADLSKSENLIAVCVGLGFEYQQMQAAIEEPQYSILIEEDKYAASQMGIRGVPYFLVGDKLTVSGAQPDEVFESTLRNVFSQYQSTGRIEPTESAGTCSTEGECN